MFTKLLYVGAVLLGVATAGCAPANYVQPVKLAPPCEVRICRDANTAMQRCNCASVQRVERQLREAGWLTEG
jgi:hypothetical protein